MKTIALCTLSLAMVVGAMLAGSVVAGEGADADAHAKAIERAVQDYVSALYDVKPELIDGAVSPRLQKVGYMPARDGSGLQENWMTFDQLKEVAGSVNKDGRFDPETSPREVTILAHTDMIATVELHAAWGVDYIHLTRNSGEWKIVNVIWEMGPQ